MHVAWPAACHPNTLCQYAVLSRPLVAEVFAGFGSAWQDHTQVASSLTTSLAVDMERVVQAEQPAEISEARRLFALANSWTAILRAAGSHLPLQWAGWP